MMTIDPALLSTVTGGQQRQAPPQQQQQAQQQAGDDQGGDQQGAAPGGNKLMAGIDQFLGFLGSQDFTQLIGGLKGIFERFAMPQQQQQQ
jgi:hypothetical protein